MFLNKNYESDIKYTTKLSRIVLRLLGIWPSIEAKPSINENLKSIASILICYALLFSELIPTVLFFFIVEKRTHARLKLLSSLGFTILTFFKYSILVLSKNRVKKCLMQVQDDWRNVDNAGAREFMMDKTKIARHLIILCGIFMYSAGLYFRMIVPLTKGKSINEQNITIRHLACPSYFVLFDGEVSPSYEFIFIMQTSSGFVKYTITVAICSLAALFALHLCAQLEILMVLMEEMVNEPKPEKVNMRIAVSVEHQIKIRNFLDLVQDTLGFMSLLELMGCTLLVCLLGHHIITDWADQNVVSMSSYMVLLTSMVFNIFIFCFIGEQLSVEGEKLSLTISTLAWYRLPGMKAQALVLIIAVSNVPTKLKAGKFMDLSIRTFGDVVKTAVTYLNLIRKVVD